MPKTKDPAPVTEQLTASEAATLISSTTLNTFTGWEETAKTCRTILKAFTRSVSFRRYAQHSPCSGTPPSQPWSAPWNQEIRWIAGEWAWPAISMFSSTKDSSIQGSCLFRASTNWSRWPGGSRKNLPGAGAPDAGERTLCQFQIRLSALVPAAG